MRPFPKSLSMQLLRARELLMQRFRPHLHAQGLTEQQWRVLRALIEVDSMSNQQLSDRCVLHAASLSRILPNLEKEGLITRRPTDDDRRHLTVRITRKGRNLVEKIAPKNDEIFDSVLEEVGEDLINDAYVVLDLLNAALSRDGDRPIMAASLESRRVGNRQARLPADDA